MNIALYTVRSMAYVITDPYLVVILMIVVLMLYIQNRKTAFMQKMIIGEPLNSPIELTLSQVVIGILAGIGGNLILSYLGVMFQNETVSLIFFISLVLMFINPRYICFSYSGAVLGLISLLMQVLFPGQAADFKVDIVSLMTLVGVLHFVEGILVMLDGKTGAIPVFTNNNGKIIGGFALKRYWILPVVIMVITTGYTGMPQTEQIMTPNWWPIIKSPVSLNALKTAVLAVSPMFGAIGYTGITFTRNKTQKAVISGFTIMCYGIILSIVSQAGNLNIFTQVLLLIFAPAAHEVMLRIGKHIESKREPLYVSDDNGIAVLDVAPNSPAFEMGIRSGDKLIEINNNKISNEKDMFSAIGEASNFIWLKIKRTTGKIEEITYNKMNNSKKFGIVFVPRDIPQDSVVVKINHEKFKDIFDKMKKK